LSWLGVITTRRISPFILVTLHITSRSSRKGIGDETRKKGQMVKSEDPGNQDVLDGFELIQGPIKPIHLKSVLTPLTRISFAHFWNPSFRALGAVNPTSARVQ